MSHHQYRKNQDQYYALWFYKLIDSDEDVKPFLNIDGRRYELHRARSIGMMLEATYVLEELNATRIRYQNGTPVGKSLGDWRR